MVVEVGPQLEQALIARAGPDLLLTVGQHGPRVRSAPHAEILSAPRRLASEALRVEGGPQTALIIGGDGLGGPGALFAGGGECFALDAVHALPICPHPEVAAPVHAQGQDKIGGEALSLGNLPAMAVRLKPEHPAPKCADNQVALRIFHGRSDGAGAPRRGAEIFFQRGRVPFLDQAVHQAPGAALALAGQDEIDLTGGKTLINGQ